MSDIIKIENKQNSIFLENTRKEYYKICGVELNGKIFVFDFFRKLECSNYAKNKEVIYFNNYIHNIIETKLKEQLKMYVIQNINNYDMYKRNRIIDIVRNLKTDISMTNIYLNNYCLDKIKENIIKINAYGTSFIYDLEKNILSVEKENKKINLLKAILTQEDLDYMVVQEQYKKGIAPNIVNELSKIQEFIKDKFTIKAILKDNSCSTIKNYSRRFIDISDLLTCYENLDLQIYRSMFSERYDRDISLQDIKAFKFGQIILPIDHERLKYEVEYKIKKKIT